MSKKYHDDMSLDEWLASPQGLHAVRWHAAWKRCPESVAIKSYLSNIMVQDATLLRLDPTPTDYDIDGIRRTHLQHVQYFARMGWDVPPEAQCICTPPCGNYNNDHAFSGAVSIAASTSALSSSSNGNFVTSMSSVRDRYASNVSVHTTLR